MINSLSCKRHVQSDFFALTVDMSKFSLPTHIQISRVHYVLKTEFHVTLIGSGHTFCKKLARLKSVTLEEAKRMATGLFGKAAKYVRFRVCMRGPFFKVYKNYSKPHKHARRSLIIRCEVENAGLFYRKLSELSGISFSMVPHHITLYTKNDGMSRKGVGLVTLGQFLRYTKAVTNKDACCLPHI